MRAASVFSVLAVAYAACAAPVMAQSPGCTLEQVGGTQRHVIRCGSGVSISAEAGADYTLLDRNGDGAVDRVRLGSKALLLDVADERTTQGFTVVAPQAIAAVRGTRWAVDAEGDVTSVFVIEGEVEVSRRRGAAQVVLQPGEGVDVDAGSGPLTVRRWPAARVDALLARFGL